MWSLLSLCFNLSLEPTPFISLSTSFWYQFLHFLLTYSFTHHFFLVWLTALLIRNSLFSFTPGLKPTCFTNPSPLPSSFTSFSRTAFTDCCPDRFFWATWFLFFLTVFISVPCARLSWPSQYHIIWCRSEQNAACCTYTVRERVVLCVHHVTWQLHICCRCSGLLSALRTHCRLQCKWYQLSSGFHHQPVTPCGHPDCMNRLSLLTLLLGWLEGVKSNQSQF